MEIRKALCVILILIVVVPAEAKRKKGSRSKDSAAKVQKAPEIASAELKFLIRDASIEHFKEWVKSIDSEFSQTKVFLFDTKETALHQQGIVMRVRRMQDETYDSSAKLRSEKVEEIVTPSGKHGKLECEQDVLYGGPQLQSCAIISKSKKVLPSLNASSANQYFNSSQIKLVKLKYPDFKWSEIKQFGPIISTEWTTRQSDIDISCELWSLPNQKRHLECSTHVSHAER